MGMSERSKYIGKEWASLDQEQKKVSKWCRMGAFVGSFESTAIPKPLCVWCVVRVSYRGGGGGGVLPHNSSKYHMMIHCSCNLQLILWQYLGPGLPYIRNFARARGGW